MTHPLHVAGDIVAAALLAALGVSLVISWASVLIRIARSSLAPSLRLALVTVVVIAGPLLGPLVGWLTLRFVLTGRRNSASLTANH